MGNEKFMKRIHELRDSKNLSQEALAEKVGVSKSGVAMWETRGVVPRKETLEKICNVLGTTTDYLLGIGEVDVLNAKINSIQRGLSKLDDKDLERAEGILRLAFSEAFGEK
ncbi:MAG: helix-turn-helix transcriptional regulator [Spirochaetales bacterium]|nr:helix-turn-helix domain-containing protein [Spirochaetia bacterium]MDD7014018.1 helix-turn-helix transcriptional regulator [Spirochaetales bacterium]